ncbi:MAG TPA: lysylphosphatidylglycerol synthase transmembrane domain-containing protein [Saprospiraceae bacterium]|nr:lysylphosphatidylglycerol synthase transmembrane domain-containing protein [Saprospiraceae bacterium]
MSSGKLNFKKILNRLILFVALGVGAHVAFVLSTTERSLLNYLGELSVLHLLTILVLIICPWLGYALRIRMWSAFLNEKISYGDAVRVVITADVASALSPTSVGGAPVKAALLLNRGYASGSVGFMLTYGVIEDIIFYTTGIVLAGFFSSGLLTDIWSEFYNFLAGNKNTISVIIFILALYIIMIRMNAIPAYLKITHYLPQRLKRLVTSTKIKFNNSLQDMKSNFKLVWQHGKLRMVFSFAVLLVQWMAKFSVLIVILHAFNIDFEAIQIYIRQWVIFVTMLFIPTPGASGGAEASFLLIFGKSIPSDIAYLVVSVWRLFTYYFILLMAAILYTLLSFFVERKEEIVITE